MKGDQIAPILLWRALQLGLNKRVTFQKNVIGNIIQEEEPFKIFRKVIVLQKDHRPKIPKALFKVKFQFKNFSFKVNKRLSLIPIPFIIAQSGFISKTWLIGTETGCFQGLYEWESSQRAENYINSLPLKLMKKRAQGDSIEFQITNLN